MYGVGPKNFTRAATKHGRNAALIGAGSTSSGEGGEVLVGRWRELQVGVEVKGLFDWCWSGKIDGDGAKMGFSQSEDGVQLVLFRSRCLQAARFTFKGSSLCLIFNRLNSGFEV